MVTVYDSTGVKRHVHRVDAYEIIEAGGSYDPPKGKKDKDDEEVETVEEKGYVREDLVKMRKADLTEIAGNLNIELTGKENNPMIVQKIMEAQE